MNPTDCNQLKVIEFASVLAGPLVGRFFAERGAQVIKIENKRLGGDITRQWYSKDEKSQAGISSYYAAANAFKESILLDLCQVEDYNIAMNLCHDADVIISNYSPQTATKLKLQESDLRTFNPHCIFAQLYSYHDEPNKPAFDMLLQAEAGYLAMNGFPGQPFAKLPIALIDIIAAHQMREGILLSLWQREKDGQGRTVKVDLFGSALSALINQGSNTLMNQVDPEPLGAFHPSIAPYGGVYLSSDKVPFTIAIGTETQFKRLWNMVAIEEAFQLFASNELRVQNRELLYKSLLAEFQKYTSHYLFNHFNNNEIPWSKVHRISEISETLKAAPYIVEEKQEGKTCRSFRSSICRITVTEMD